MLRSSRNVCGPVVGQRSIEAPPLERASSCAYRSRRRLRDELAHVGGNIACEWSSAGTSIGITFRR